MRNWFAYVATLIALAAIFLIITLHQGNSQLPSLKIGRVTLTVKCTLRRCEVSAEDLIPGLKHTSSCEWR